MWETLIEIKETEDVEASPAKSPESSRHRPRWFWPAIASASSFLLIAMGVVIYVMTDYGTIKIMVDDPKPEVTIDGKEIKIKTWQESITLRTGEHELIFKWRDGQPKPRDDRCSSRGGKGGAHRVSTDC